MTYSTIQIVEALRQVESAGAGSTSTIVLGDNGHALGPWQLHPEFMVQWYQGLFDTWLMAMENAVARMVSHYLSEGRTAEEIAQIFHLGYDGWRDHGPDASYAKRFADALQKIS